MMKSTLHVPTPVDALVVIAATLLLLQIFGPLFISLAPSPWGNSLVQIFLVFGPAFVFLLLGKFSFRSSLPLHAPGFRGVLGGVLLGVSVWFPAGLALQLAYLIFGEASITAVDQVLRQALENAEDQVGVFGVTLFFGALPGIAEEFLFRGFLLAAFLRRFSLLHSILISAFLFGMFHLNIPQGFSTTVIGGFLAYAVARTHSLWVAMIAHAVHNALIVLLALFWDSSQWNFALLLPMVLVTLIGGLWILPKQSPKTKQFEDVGQKEEFEFSPDKLPKQSETIEN